MADTSKETKLEAVQRLARSSGYNLTVTRDYLESIKLQVESALNGVNSMLRVIEKSKSLIAKEGQL